MESPSQIFVFGDQTNASEADLRRLLHAHDNVVLTSFLERATQTLRLEIARLSSVQQEWFPRFSTLFDLLTSRHKKGNNPALGLALLCINQLARFIKYYSEGSRQYPHWSTSYAIGLCTGSFAAAAICTSQSISELFPAAIEAIAVAFRTGLSSFGARNDIEGSSSISSAWSMLVGMQLESASECLEAFSRAKGLSSTSRPYVSAVTSTHVTISGPSAVLQQLSQSEPFSSLKPVGLTIYAPYHASHIYGPSDVEAILAPCDKDTVESYRLKFPLISSATGRRAAGPNYLSLLREALNDILINQLRWDHVLQESPTEFSRSLNGKQMTIFPILSTSTQSLASMISQTNQIRATINDACTAENSKAKSSSPDSKTKQSKIAIVGYSGRFPKADGTEELWNLLHEGLDVHQEIPKDRFNIETHYDPTGKKRNTTKVKYGCFIDEPGLYDARFFNMSPREAANADPAQRLAVTTAYEAMEMAGFVPNRTASSQRDRVGTFYGTTSDDWREVNSGQNVDTYFIPGGNRAFIPGRINYHFKFSGPSFSVDTACSSSFAAINIACNALWRGDCDTAIAGGTNVLTNPDNFTGLDRGHFLSTTGNCNPFDDDANGYCRADAVGTVILKRLEDAIADNDPIKGVILGAHTNHSAEAESMTRPHVGAQAFIFNKILDTTNVDPLDVSYVEMHGTGTQAGDAVEMKSVLDTFASNARGPEYPLHLGSVKANVGHAESGSGVTSLIKVLKMMEKHEIPPHCGIKTKINHNFPTDLKQRNVNIALEPTPWERPVDGTGKRTAMLNNFSAAGGNTAVLIEDAPIKAPTDHLDPRTCHLVAISGKSKLSVRKNIEALSAFIGDNSSLSLSSLAYTTTARRIHHNYRVMVKGPDLRSIKEALQRFGSCEALKPIPIPAKVPRVNFVFTGQGALYAGVARQLFEHISQFRADIQRFNRIAQNQGFPSFMPLIDSNIKTLDLVHPMVSQVGAVCIQMALAQLWMSVGVSPSTVIGHSLGEYAALYTAGVVSASDAIFLAGSRARLLEARCTAGTHSMLAVKAPLSKLGTHMIQTGCELACINGPDDIVLSGPSGEIDTLSNALAKQNMKSTKLQVPFAFHSSQVESILEDFESAANAVEFNKPSVPYISPLLVEVINDKGIIGPSYLRRACRETVNFQAALTTAKDEATIKNEDVWVEIGAHPVCSNMIKAILGPQITTLSSLRRNDEIWSVLSNSLAVLYLAGFELQWNEIHRDFVHAQQVLQLPSYRWDSKNYWIQYENDFCLTKGAPQEPTSVEPASAAKHPLSTASVQRVVEEQLGPEKSSIIIESDLHHPALAEVIQGHVVNGVTLCSSSLWADVALTLANYLLECVTKDTKNVGIDVTNMVIEKPLIATGSGPQLFRASCTLTWEARSASVKLYSVTSEGKKIADHGRCTVLFDDKEAWRTDWRRNAYLIKSRIESLGKDVDHGESHKLKRGLAYKLFSALVDYSPHYQGMQEVILNSKQLEATAKVEFQTTEKEEDHYFSPCWVDSLGHIAGFIMNANDDNDSKRQVFINHGWESMRCATRFSRGTTYRTYNRMQLFDRTMYAGDTYIFDGDEVVAIFKGVKFQGVPRQVLDNLSPGGKVSQVPPKPLPSKQPSSEAIPKPRSDARQKQNLLASAHQRVAKSTTQVNQPEKTNLVAQISSIIAEEVGVDQSELKPTSSFVDSGIDSLLSLNIASRLREDLGLEIEGSAFFDCETILDLAELLSPGTTARSSTPGSTVVPKPISDSASAVSEDTTYDDDDTDQTSTDGDETNVMGIIRQTIAREVGISEDDLTESLDFIELGIDSLLSLNILGTLRDIVEMDLPPSLFADNTNLAEVEASLGLKSKGASIPREPIRAPVEIIKDSFVSHTIPEATSMLLQGHPKSADKILFLFPDGSGSATSYAALTRISPQVAVYGLNCPYIKTPRDMKCSLEAITPSYLQEIRRRQPKGPYYFAGWSAGGVCAFDAAQALDRLGEKVERLIFIDSPCPIGLEKLPPRLFDFFKSIGMFGEGGQAPPEWLLPHFLAFVDSLDLYRAKPFAKGQSPQTHIIWARDGVCKFPNSPRPEMREDDPREMKWLLNNRTDFGSNGWDCLLDAEHLFMQTMDNANHFSMMAEDKVRELATFIRNAME